MQASVLFHVINNPSKEAKWYLIKQYITNLLSQCDWTQLSDSGLSLSQQVMWMEYRQTLKDIDTTYQNPDDVVFPDAPVGVRP